VIDLLPRDPVRRGRAKLLLLAAFFALPVFGGYAAFLFDLAPGTKANYGELVAPRLLPAAALERLDGKPFSLQDLRGKWVLVQLDAGACDAWCERKLYFMRQIRTAQGKDAPRIERLWLLEGAQSPKPELLAAIEGTHVARLGAGRLAAEFPVVAGNGRPADHIYLIDPLGNLMMRFPREPDPTRMIRDLQRLLKYSQIG
jgi:cytochrome oxidase Cu insertion factor (SCO1/SenC/PrrC family)